MLLVGNGLNLEALKNSKESLIQYKNVLEEPRNELMDAFRNSLWKNKQKQPNSAENFAQKHEEICQILVKILCTIKVQINEKQNFTERDRIEKTSTSKLLSYLLKVWHDNPGYETLSSIIPIIPGTASADLTAKNDIIKEKLRANLVSLMGENGAGGKSMQTLFYKENIREKLNSYDLIVTTNYDDWIRYNCPQFKDQNQFEWPNRAKYFKPRMLIHLHGSLAERNVAVGDFPAKNGSANAFWNLLNFHDSVKELDIFGINMANEVHLFEQILRASCEGKVLALKKIRHYIYEGENVKSLPELAEKYHGDEIKNNIKIANSIKRLQPDISKTKSNEDNFYEIIDSKKWHNSRTAIQEVLDEIYQWDD